MNTAAFFDNAWRDADYHIVSAPERTAETITKEIRMWLLKAQDNLFDIGHYRTTGQPQRAEMALEMRAAALAKVAALEIERAAY